MKLKLASGYEMPVLGIGTWMLRGDKCKEAVKKAIELGYTHIDTAALYSNHKEVGEAIKESGIERGKLFITTKVHADNLCYEDVLRECDKALQELQLEYIDLYLIHWPNSNIPIEETMKAFKKLVDDKKARSIGISNFTVKRMQEAIEKSEIPISVNQVEYHAHLNQEELLRACKESNIVLTAYCPLARGELLNDPVLKEIAEKYSKTISQVALKWLVQKDTIVIPKASSESHIKENMDIFSWGLSEEDIEKINEISKKERIVDPGFVNFDDE